MKVTPTVEIFKNFRGRWNIHRSLKSEPGYGFSGVMNGQATFTPRKPTSHSTTLELMYSENGQLTTDTGLTLTASRKYVYRYNADEDKISVWFVKEATKDQQGKEEVDELFMDIEINKQESVFSGRGEHLCSMDMYWADYQWRYGKSEEQNEAEDDEEEAEINVWGLRYKVKGPQKDYISNTAYQRVET